MQPHLYVLLSQFQRRCGLRGAHFFHVSQHHHRSTKLGSQIVALWLLGISVNLLTTGMFCDLAMRDVEIAIAAFVLSQLSAVRAQQPLATASQRQ